VDQRKDEGEEVEPNQLLNRMRINPASLSSFVNDAVVDTREK
jgi:hypothetical protein